MTGKALLLFVYLSRHVSPIEGSAGLLAYMYYETAIPALGGRGPSKWQNRIFPPAVALTIPAATYAPHSPTSRPMMTTMSLMSDISARSFSIQRRPRPQPSSVLGLFPHDDFAEDNGNNDDDDDSPEFLPSAGESLLAAEMRALCAEGFVDVSVGGKEEKKRWTDAPCDKNELLCLTESEKHAKLWSKIAQAQRRQKANTEERRREAEALWAEADDDEEEEEDEEGAEDPLAAQEAPGGVAGRGPGDGHMQGNGEEGHNIRAASFFPNEGSELLCLAESEKHAKLWSKIAQAQQRQEAKAEERRREAEALWAEAMADDDENY